ncbi:LOW QUALITY PROTEIN: PTTG1IP family member 2 [Erythrolamprus reginae]|uniref:LOW QUALITY PROTEIN: PTTG1IP family member 2 n=1 Tax=Erythrolamprus reginae TaxID=121349 RepID=UPI00396C9DFB
MGAGERTSVRLLGFALGDLTGDLTAVTMACWQRLCILAAVCALLCRCPTMGVDTVSTVSPSPTSAPSCSHFTGMQCEACTKYTTCLWCSENSTCMDYPVNKILPPSSSCSLTKSYWAICWASLEAIVIAIGVVVGILLVFIICCCCYCCRRCRWRSVRRIDEEEETFIGDREEKRLQHAQRRHERKVKYDELRRKYGVNSPKNVCDEQDKENTSAGLLQDSDHPYSRYENE